MKSDEPLPSGPGTGPPEASDPGEVYVFPASFAQRRLFFLGQLTPDSPAYNISSGFRMTGRLRLDALRTCFAWIAERHEILRTSFSILDGQPVQVVAMELAPPVELVDLAGLAPGARGEKVSSLLSREALRPFDLGRPPLWRVLVLKLSEREHVLFYVMHHIITDAWSEEIFMRETAELYRAASSGSPPSLPELEIQYGDFAEWQKETFEGERLDELFAFWKERLEGASDALDLFGDFPRPGAFTHRGAGVRASVPGEVRNALARLGQSEGATLYATLLAALGVVLMRRSGRSDLLVGSPVANRPQVELEALIGFFVNTLILRLDMTGGLTFREHLKRVRETVLSAQEHQDLPFEMLTRELQLERDPSRNPLVQVVFNMETASRRSGAALEELSLEPLDLHPPTARFDLVFTVFERPDELVLGLEYYTDLFAPETARQILDAFRRCLESVARDADEKLSRLPLVSPAERRALLDAARPVAAFPAGGSLDERFVEQARRRPDAVAVVCGEERLSYGELDRRSAALARELAARLPAGENRVGLCFDRSAGMLIALLATLRAGAAYVPLDPAYPRDRLEFLARDAGLAVTLSEARLAESLPAAAGEAILVDELPAGEETPEPLTGRARPDSAAYVIYTSGSTGQPKGVVISHRHVLRLFEATEGDFGFGAGDAWSLFHSFAFDFSVWEIWGAWLYGGRLVVVPHGVSRSPDAFRRLLAEERVTILSQTPSAFDSLDREDRRVSGRGDGGLPALRHVVFGGEALETTRLGGWFERHGDRRPRLVNMYGITETTVHVTYREVSRADLAPRTGSAIGVPIRDLGIYLRDGAGEPVPAGMPGEIHVAGAGVARGYLGRPRLTAERFVPDPWSGEAGARLYRAGDLARSLADGSLAFLGRVDDQVQIRGFRIEPAEIEAALLHHPGVAGAAVVARELGGATRLVAYVVSSGPRLEADTLRTFLDGRLPVHMLPALFVPLDVLPTTASGKLDRRALPEPESQRPDLRSDYVAPRDAAEETLAAIWSEVLGVEKVGIEDNFFALGGDSMNSIEVVARARERGFELSVPELFKHPTLASLSRRLSRSGGLGPAAGTDRFSLLRPEDRRRLPAGVEDAYPLSRLQAGMLYHRLEHPGSAVFHNVNSHHLSLRFDRGALEAALQAAAVRHAVLRTSFDLTGFSEPLQLVHGEARFPLGFTDPGELEPERAEEEVRSYVARELRTPFDLSVWPQLRFHVHRRGESAFQLTVTENHAVLDGWSLHTLFSEILSHYLAALAGEDPPSPPPLRSSFSEFIRLERDALASPASRDFWRRHLSGVPIPRVPALAEGPPADGEPRCRRVDTRLDAAVTEKLYRLADGEEVSLKTLLLAAHFKVMGRLTGEMDVLTGLSSNGRPETPDGQRICGLFLNTLPVRRRLGGGSWRELIQAVHRLQLEVLPHRRYPLAAIQEEWGTRTLLETSFVYLNFRVMRDVLSESRLETRDEGVFAEDTNFAVMTSFMHDFNSADVHLSMACDRTVLSDGQIDRLRDDYLATLAAMAADPSARYEHAVPLDEAERRQVLGRGLAGGAAPPATPPVHELFLAAAARTPERLAVVTPAGRWTFAQVEHRSARLARRLQRRGAGPEARVALCLERSADLVVALLGVLRSGAAYVPLEPGFPDERLARLLKESEPLAVITAEEERGRFVASGVDTLVLDGESGDGGTGESPALEPPASRPGHLAYLMFTSGSTGRPKAVAVEHRHLSTYLAAARERLDLPGDAAYGVLSTLAADLGITTLLPPLIGAGTLVLAPEDTARDPAAAVAFLRAHPLDCLKIVPSHLAALLEHPEAADLLPRQRLIFGGEALDRALVERVREQLLRHGVPGCRIFNHYGPTETTVGVVAGELGDTPGDGAPPPLGRPLAGARLQVLDAHGQLLPAGTSGELALGGGTVTRGYFGRPGRTAERFVPDAHGQEPGARLYLSGDRVRFARSGELVFLGRVDHQVKVRGYRVELGEIRQALLSLDGVRDAAVVLRGGDAGARLVGYVVPSGEGAVSEEAVLEEAVLEEAVLEKDLRAALRRRLPEYMVPRALVTLDALPLTPNGKLDRDALPVPEAGGSADGRKADGPRNRLELQLLHLWEETLGLSGIGVTDDFYEIGGNSLVVVRLLAQLKRRFGLDLPLGILVEAPTVRRLAERMSEGQDESAPRHLVALQPRGAKPPFYCVHPGHGDVSSYLDLARHLGRDQPFFGLQALDLDRDGDPYRSVEELAGRYLEAVREHQPEGPYFLGGWSFGGLVAFEMAQRLVRDGQTVRSLALLDARSTLANARLAALEPDLMRAFVLLENAKAVAGLSARELAMTAHDLAGLEVEEQLERVLGALAGVEALPEEIDPGTVRRYLDVRVARFRAIREYQAGIYPGRLTLFRAREVYTDTALPEAADIFEDSARHPLYHWDRFTSVPVELVEVPGNHETIIREPHVRALAGALGRHLDEASARGADDVAGDVPDATDVPVRRQRQLA